MHLKIPFSEIPESGVVLEITETSWFPEHLVDDAGPFAAQIQLTRKQDNTVELQGSIRTAIKLSCDRCLREYEHTVASRLQIIIERPETDRHWHLQDIEVSEGELETVQVEEPVVDLGDILRQQIYLSLPVKQLCVEHCRGLCAHCGINLNETQCSCKAEHANSPFAILASLKKTVK